MLPLLQWSGYQPGSRDAQGLLALSLAYAVLPCALKLLAAMLLWRLDIHAKAAAWTSTARPDTEATPWR